MRLVVDGFGKFLGCKGETLVVRENKKAVTRLQPRELEQVIISGKGCVSTDALRLLAEHGVDVLIVDFRGNVQARLSPPEMRTVNTRRQQYLAYTTPKGVEIARAVVEAKLKNQIAVLGTLAKKRKDSDPETADALYGATGGIRDLLSELSLVEGSGVEEVRLPLMNLEGRAAQLYWDALSKILGVLGFEKRSGRYARDPVNAMLNYGYGILLGEVWRSVHYAGLDPYGGFLHADKPGKPSMALDLMEEFRPHLVDRVSVKLVSKHMVSREDFELVQGICQMRDRSRRLYLQELLEGVESEVRIGDQKLRFCDAILYQARKLAKFLRGEEPKYEGFWQRW